MCLGWVLDGTIYVYSQALFYSKSAQSAKLYWLEGGWNSRRLELDLARGLWYDGGDGSPFSEGYEGVVR